MRSTWYEMFVDLLYVGVFTKAGLFISTEQSWEAFTKFVFVMIPLISHWHNFTMYNNSVSHEDLYMKFHFLFICISAMVMGNTIVNSFSPDPASNTSATFLLSYICARLYIHCAQFVVCFVFDRRFSKAMTPVLIFRALSIVPHAIILAFPTNGTTERDNTRWGLWWFGSVMELIHPFISIPVMRALPNVNFRVAINIEHIAERTGILYTYALGVVAVTFLYDTKSQHIQLVMGVMILALIIGNNLNHLYFRHESGNHFKHAMRRAWYTGLGWTFIHYPLVIATLSLGAVMSVMITVRFNQAENIVDSPIALKNEWKNIYFVSLGAIYFCFMSLGLLHQNQPPTPKKTTEEKQALKDESETKVKTKKLKIRTRMPNLSQEKRCIIILALTMVIVVVGVAVPEQYWSVEGMFGFGAGITSFSVFMMEWAILKKAKGPKQVVEL
ncbi:hypothetical protein HDU99_004272 [Rhizoclosmatium hyalinum]|nr:hypothetical protein HDU99_004272 [Rhizoclosmatium hyalinum]